MKYTRRTAIATMGLGAAAVVATVPSSARAATAPKVVAWGNVPDDLGRVLVGIESASPVTAIKAHLVHRTHVEVAVVEAFDLVSGSQTNGVWHSSERLSLPLDYYRLDYEVWSADGGYVRVDDVQPGLRLAIRSRLEDFSVTPTTIGSQANIVTATGRVLVTHPSTNVTEPLAGGAVRVYFPSLASALVPTDANGVFRAEAAIKRSGRVSAQTYSTETYFNHSGAEQQVEAVATLTRLSAELSKKTVLKNGTVELTGQLEQQLDGVWVPFPGKRLEVNFQAVLVSGELVTDEQGRFSAVYQPNASATRCEVVYWEGDTDLYRTSRASIDDFQVLLPVEVVDFELVWTPFPPYDLMIWQVSGSVVYPDGYRPTSTLVHIETSKDGESGWTSLGTIDTYAGATPRQFLDWFRLSSGSYVRATVKAQDRFLAGSSATRLVPVTRRTRRPVELGPATLS